MGFTEDITEKNSSVICETRHETSLAFTGRQGGRDKASPTTAHNTEIGAGCNGMLTEQPIYCLVSKSLELKSINS